MSIDTLFWIIFFMVLGASVVLLSTTLGIVQ